MCAIVGEGSRRAPWAFHQPHADPTSTSSTSTQLAPSRRPKKSLIAEGHEGRRPRRVQMTANHVGMEGELWWLTQIARTTTCRGLCAGADRPDARHLEAPAGALDGTHAQGLPLYGSISGRATSMVMGLRAVAPVCAQPAVAADCAPAHRDAKRWPAARAAGARHAHQHEGGGDGGAGEPGSRPSSARHGAAVCVAPTPMAAWTTNRCWATAWWRRHRRPAPTRWKLRTTRCWPTTAPGGPRNDGKGLLYFPVFNYSYGDLSQIHTELQHPRTMMSLG